MCESKVLELANLAEKAKLSEEGSKSFQEKYESVSKEKSTLKEQLDKLGVELSNEVDKERKDNEALKVKIIDFEYNL